MKLKYEFKTMKVADETLAIPVGDAAQDFHGALRVNEVAADIIELLKQQTTEEAIIDALLKEYYAGYQDIAESVHKVIMTLREENLLDG